MNSRRLLFIALIAGLIVTTSAFILPEVRLQGLVFTGITALAWIYGLRRAKSWSIQIGFVLNILLAAYANFNDAHPFITLGIALLSLAAWDLARFAQQIEHINPPQAAQRLERIHLRRLAGVLSLGLAAGTAANLLRFQLSFPVAVLLGLAAFFLLALSMRRLFRSEDQVSEDEFFRQ